MITELKAMADENRRLQRMYAKMSMQNDLLKEASLGKSVEAVSAQRDGRGISIALACRTFQVSECCYRYGHMLSDENSEVSK